MQPTRVLLVVGLADSNSADDGRLTEASHQLDRISDKFEPVATTTSNLSTIFVSLVVWVAVVTVLLAAIIIVTCRHRRSASADFDSSVRGSDSISSCSVQL